MHKHFITALALLAFTATPACDAPEADEAAAECPAVDGSEPFVVSPRLAFAAPEDAPPPAEYTFREQGPPAGLYTSKINGVQIKRADVAKLVLTATQAGLVDPAQTCTLSWYQPDTTKSEMVLGLGCSMMAPFKLWDHYRQIFIANGATPF
jgi:hypothetical protein